MEKKTIHNKQEYTGTAGQINQKRAKKRLKKTKKNIIK